MPVSNKLQGSGRARLPYLGEHLGLRAELGAGLWNAVRAHRLAVAREFQSVLLGPHLPDIGVDDNGTVTTRQARLAETPGIHLFR